MTTKTQLVEQLKAASDTVRRELDAATARDLRYKALVNERDVARETLRTLQTKRRSTYKMAPLPAVQADALHLVGYAWKWAQADRNGVVLQPKHFYRTLRFATWLPLTDRHASGVSIGRVKCFDDGIGLRADAYLDPPRDFKSAQIQSDAHARRVGFSIQYDLQADGTADLIEVALTPSPAHAGAVILSVGR